MTDPIVVEVVRPGRHVDESPVTLKWEKHPGHLHYTCYIMISPTWVPLPNMDCATHTRLGERVAAFVSFQLPSIMLLTPRGNLGQLSRR
jgi:hypothetical protein